MLAGGQRSARPPCRVQSGVHALAERDVPEAEDVHTQQGGEAQVGDEVEREVEVDEPLARSDVCVSAV